MMRRDPPSDIERRDPPPSDMERKGSGNLRRRDNVIHPVEAETSASSFHWRREFLPFGEWFPWLIPTFLLVNVTLFLISMYINNCPKNSVSCVARFLGRFSFQPFKENPLLGPSAVTLEKMGALEVSKVVHKHQAWRLFTCIWLHAGVFHVLANMLSLLFIGIRLEQEFGFVRIGLLYVISGFGGSLSSALFIQSNISVGASGALFGLLGGMLSELITNWTIYENKVVALLTLLFIIVVNLAVGILPHVDNFAHLGGFASGFLLGFVFLIRPQFAWVSQRSSAPNHTTSSMKPKHMLYQHILLVLALILLIVGFAVGSVMLFRGVNGNDHCSWCHYLSCVPTSSWSCKSDAMYCLSSQNANQLNLTCQGSGRTKSYPLSNVSDSQIKALCAQLCS
ncbi:RHOMBOID-like protein 1 [Macadamia integrifolia]|uniref:RHOMBOID-like protein 1 n=1 Tax=Macadamia integrifolia TaxID=60698 RepID=UPI001C528722|nr:RHOMBOID-like protein 1 [Macadamia integrifolia]XP_042474906.1 RHOMBOID-like protein 1 [Macadamia integrifolia]XP_042474907.1 RHOMBOID-like protein 1 [Macadamia integrifolia]